MTTRYETPGSASAPKEDFAILVVVQKLVEPETNPAKGLITVKSDRIIHICE